MKQQGTREFNVTDYRRTIKFEYRIYFAVIFLVSIPLAMVAWSLHLILNGFSRDRVKNEGIFSRAWGHARVITPMIFAA